MNDDVFNIDNYIPVYNGISDMLANDLPNKIKKLSSTLSVKVIDKNNSLDIISYNSYNTYSLWWVLALYNNISDVININGLTINIPEFNSLIKLLSDNRLN